MKKKQLITLILLWISSLPFALNAQVQIAGNFGFHYVKSGVYNKTLTYSVAPKIGFEINDKVLVGGLIGYTGFSFKEESSYLGAIRDENIGIFMTGIYSRFTTLGSDKIRLLIEPSLSMGIEPDNIGLILGFITVPVVQLRMTEKMHFDMTLGLMGLTIVSAPSVDFWELFFGISNYSGISNPALFGAVNSIMTPLVLGFTYSL